MQAAACRKQSAASFIVLRLVLGPKRRAFPEVWVSDPIMTTPLPIGSVCPCRSRYCEKSLAIAYFKVACVSYEFAAFHTILA